MKTSFSEARMGPCVIMMSPPTPSPALAVDLPAAVSSCPLAPAQAPWGGAVTHTAGLFSISV